MRLEEEANSLLLRNSCVGVCLDRTLSGLVHPKCGPKIGTEIKDQVFEARG